MAFIELTSRDKGRKTIVGVNHIVRYGAAYERDTIVGSYVVISVPFHDRGISNHFIQVKELPDQVEELLGKAQVQVHRLGS